MGRSSSQFSGRITKGLTLYYILWQAAHLGLNAYGILFDRSFIRDFLARGIGDEAFQSLLLSGWADLCFISPLGVIAGFAFIKERPWGAPHLLISVWGALYSAYVYGYLHGLHGPSSVGISQLFLVWGPFLPVIFLALLLPYHLTEKSKKDL